METLAAEAPALGSDSTSFQNKVSFFGVINFRGGVKKLR